MACRGAFKSNNIIIEADVAQTSITEPFDLVRNEQVVVEKML